MIRNDLGICTQVDVSTMSKKEQSHIKECSVAFGKTNDLNEKRRLLRQIPNFTFGKCRCCGNEIVYRHWEIRMYQGLVHDRCPKDKDIVRMYGDKEHHISVCQECFEKHFEGDLPPKNGLILGKGQKWQQYVYNLSDEELTISKKNTVAVTEKAMIRKWGEKEGLKRWEAYKRAQAKSNTYEYKKEKYGWTPEEYKEFNKSRAITKELCIQRHGEEEGLKMWEQYCERQRYTTSLEYMIEEYGLVDGKRKYESYISKICQNIKGKVVSSISIECFECIVNKSNTSNDIYYGYNNEYSVKDFRLDFYDKTLNLVIEFNGDFWHGNPQIYNPTDIIGVGENRYTAQEKWQRDKEREDFIKKELHNPIYIVIWERDYRKNPDKIINEIVEKYYG